MSVADPLHEFLNVSVADSLHEMTNGQLWGGKHLGNIEVRGGGG